MVFSSHIANSDPDFTTGLYGGCIKRCITREIKYKKEGGGSMSKKGARGICSLPQNSRNLQHRFVVQSVHFVPTQLSGIFPPFLHWVEWASLRALQWRKSGTYKEGNAKKVPQASLVYTHNFKFVAQSVHSVPTQFSSMFLAAQFLHWVENKRAATALGSRWSQWWRLWQSPPL